MSGNIPKHVAIIMDGNGRWATARGLPRLEGHRKGAEAARVAVDAAARAGIQYLTLFSFSSENWNRPDEEVTGLMELLRFYLKKETAELHKKGAKLLVIGDREKLPEDISALIDQAESVTKENDKITVVIALSYGGRQDILQAAKKLAVLAQQGKVNPATLDENIFAHHLMTDGIPDPDLLIRTSGETRVSNFLLWQMAYTEMYFTDVLWPDFSLQDIDQAISFYNGRERRFGALNQKAGQ